MKTRLFQSECIAVILFFTLLIASVGATETLTIQVAPYGGTSNYVNLNSGDKFSGSFSVNGGDGGIAYMVYNPVGQIVTSTNGIVYTGGGIVFTADLSGTYRLAFYNGQTTASKVVVLSYDVYGSDFFSYLIRSGILWIIIVFVIILAVIIGLLVVRNRRKHILKKQSTTTA